MKTPLFFTTLALVTGLALYLGLTHEEPATGAQQTAVSSFAELIRGAPCIGGYHQEEGGLLQNSHPHQLIPFHIGAGRGIMVTILFLGLFYPLLQIPRTTALRPPIPPPQFSRLKYI